ncbi:hypothetical protein TI04_06895 [Achromatium sp. WMS2]|nr:hypothetical protein TI04_06895 [Achromatium sp. WMS2]
MDNLRLIDTQLAHKLGALSGEQRPEILLAVTMLSYKLNRGDICLDLMAYKANTQIASEIAQTTDLAVHIPTPIDWKNLLNTSPMVGSPGDSTPLVLEGNYLYLGRYWQLETNLIQELMARIGTWIPNVDTKLLKASLKHLFFIDNNHRQQETNWQCLAAALAVFKPFCIISGGPGTGKTRTVTAILALLIEQSLALYAKVPRIALGVPTGKAAARLTESIRKSKASLLQNTNIDQKIINAIPEEALTLHRLLKFRPGRCEPQHGKSNQLPIDVLVIDEASMLDLPMMARVLSALTQSSRLILLGDRHQLASVEAGMVMGDLCGGTKKLTYSYDLVSKLSNVADINLPYAEANPPAIVDHQIILEKSYRFPDDSGIGQLAKAVNSGVATQALNILKSGKYPDVTLIPGNPESLMEALKPRVIAWFRHTLSATDPTQALTRFNNLRILCALRSGPYGVNAINKLVATILTQAGLIDTNSAIYHGCPIMVTKNDYKQHLYNGDIGLILQDHQLGVSLRAFFETSEGIRRILPNRIPPHELVYAMTVHKSQGSEFDEVIMILPNVASDIITRELIYTGITRAKKHVTLIAEPIWLSKAISRVVTRDSGLFRKIWL